MRSWALIGICFLVTGCSGVGQFLDDTASLPGENPNMPSGNSENLMRAQGVSPTIVPILPQEGDIWPGEPKPLPTLSDVARNHDTGKPLSYEEYLPKGTVGNGQGSSLLQEGGTLKMGESEDVHKGVVTSTKTKGMPTFLPTESTKYKAQALTSSIIIPNGDGTSTVISPEGVVSVVKDSALHPGKDKSAEKNGHSK